MRFYMKFIIIFVLFLPKLSFSQEMLIQAPDFSLISGDHQSISLTELSSKVTVCFYETKDTIDKNNNLKNELSRFKDGFDNLSQKEIFVLAVADCSQAKWPFVGFWEKAIIDQSKKIGYTLYGDWNGKMRENYTFVKNEANFAIIDKNAMIRYRISGKVSPDEIVHIKNIILSLLTESE